MIEDKPTHAAEIISRLQAEYPDAHCALHHSNAFELLVATILSAQCTDERVNIVTATLFRKYRSPQHFLEVSQTEIAEDIKSINFFNNKSKSIQNTAQKIVENFGGEVPQTMDELLTLNGVARKTANVVLGNWFGNASGVVVDTHVSRLSQRLGLTVQTAPEKIETDLNQSVAPELWVIFPHLLISHGRKICQPRKPKCLECVLGDICPSAAIFAKHRQNPKRPT